MPPREYQLMNIFVLDTNPKLAAKYHCDQHVVKMILESAQMLSTVIGHGYKPTHVNHPCTVWLRQSQSNCQWLIELACHLNNEYKSRFGHRVNHKSWDVIAENHIFNFDHLPDVPMTPFALAMPDQYKSDDAVYSYRNYYRLQKPFATWRNEKPEWMK